MNGAEKFVSAMKKVGKAQQTLESEVLSATVISKSPLIFQLENRLKLDSSFYVLSNLEDFSKAEIGYVYRCFSFNDGQKYYILEKLPLNPDTNSAGMDERIKVARNDIGVLQTSVQQINQQLIIIEKASGLPVGGGCDFYGTTPPEGYLFADGSEISRTDYAELFTIIGTTYGAGNGQTTFNLPDKRERVSVMYKENSTMGTTGATFGTMGAKGGEDVHTLDTTELPSHSHKITAKEGYGVGSTYYVGGIHQETTTSTKEINTGNTGGGNAHNNLQPYLVCNYIIRVK